MCNALREIMKEEMAKKARVLKKWVLMKKQ